MLYLCLFASFSLMSCSQDENMLSENNNDDKEFVVSVDFSVSGIADYGESNQPTTRSTASPVKKVIPLNEDFEAEVTLTPDVPVQTRSAAPTQMAEGVYFRVLAYKGNTYKGHADYKIVGGMVELAGTTKPLILYNNTYKFIAYSYNKGDYLPIWNSVWETTGPNLPINAEEHDFLYWTEDITLDQEIVKLPIVFSHLLPQFKVKLDTSEMLGLNCVSASVTLEPSVPVDKGGFITKSGTWNPLTHNDNNNNGFISNTSAGNNYTPNIQFSESDLLNLQDYVLSSSPKILFPITTKGLNLTLNAKFGNAQWRPGEIIPTEVLNKKILQLGQHTFLSGRSYTCLVKIKRSSMTEVPHTTEINNCILINVTATYFTNYYSFNVSYEGSGTTSDILGTALHGITGMSPAKVVVLWQETDPINSKFPLISGVRYLKDDKKILMAINGKLEGNAVLAAIDSGGDIIWTWHIWVLENSDYYGGLTGKLKKVNIGATRSNPGGLLYQYGRKEPLRRTDIQTLDTEVAPADAHKLGISNPMHFIKNWSWNSNFWSGDRSYKFNPCPNNHRLPTLSEFTTGDFTSGGEDGFIESNGSFNGTEGGFWTNTPGTIFVPSTKKPSELGKTSAAYPIRCVKY